jgi:hypothetical protein
MTDGGLLVPHAHELSNVKHQSLCRDANEQILNERRAEGPGRTEFMCECADLSCDRRMTLDLEEYEAVRRFPTHFIVSTGHADRWRERIVEERVGYSVVEKFGPDGIAAVKLDRRSRPATETVA